MDDSLKNQTNDLAAYTGIYPDQTKKAEPTVTDQNTDTTTKPPPSFTGTTELAKEPSPPTSPIMTTVPLTSIPDVSPSPFEQTPVSTPSQSEPPTTSPPPAPESPVTPSSSPPPKPKSTGGTLKRLLIIVVLIVGLLTLGMVLFRLMGSFLAGRQPVTLTYWGLWEDEQMLKSVIDEYKKAHPNVEIVYSKQNPKQYRERLQAAIERGEGPDLFRFHNTWVPMLKVQLAPAGKTGYTATEFKETFYPVSNRDLVIDGTVYGVPLMFDGLALYYNEDLLRAAGITPPTSWEDFRTAALSMTVKNENGQIVTAGAALGTANNIEHFSDIVAVMMLQNGADLKNPTSKEAQDALSFYRLFAQPPSNVWDETLDNSIVAFASGRVAFIFAPSWQVFTIRQLNPELKFQIIPIPQLPGTSTTWASYWVEGVSNKSKHRDEAWEFLKFLVSSDSLVALYTEAAKVREFGEPYSRLDLAQTVVNDPYIGAYIRQAQTAESFFLASRTFDNGINDQMIKYLEDALNSLGQGVSVEAALTTAAQGFLQVLSRFGAAPVNR